MLRACRLALGFACLLAATAHAQAVRGVLVERGNNRPIRGAFVVLLDEQDAEVARVLTDDAGRFLIRAPAPGRYRLQSKRIGFRLSVSPPLVLDADQTVIHRMEVEVVPAMLPPVVVEGRPQCGSRGEAGSVTARLWEEAREALSAVSWTSDQRLHRYQLMHFVRDFGPGGDRPISDSSWTTSGYAESPFSSLPARELADRGFVVKGRGDTVDYYAPDANVLLSDAFLSTHCFTARDGEAEHQGLVGLAFEPAPGRFLPDVRGVLWFDRRSAELRGLVFTYTNLPPDLPEGVLGGSIDFMRLGTGAWIVQRWWIRMARMGRVVYRDTGRMPEPRVLGFRQRGGQVLSISTTRGTVVYSARQAILEGAV
ncbi:MAG TPA: carboxypeptidase-like regulatory domain-containing protein, partial [Gemmatimonadales bacterium]|nr:carboxypeptidase-like regulatory domain-containing protein [Gemmatimonadales bacterium]